jgi:RNA-binding protein
MLNGKQKAYLRSLAQNERAILQIGKDGLSDTLIQTLNDALKARELVKVSVLKTGPVDDMKETAFDLAMHTKSEVVQIIGHTIVLYKKGKEAKILLP